MILNVTLFVLWGLGLQYREELILNVTVFVVWCPEKAIERGTDPESYCFCDALGRAIYSGTFSEYHSTCFEKLGRANERGTNTECYSLL